MSGSALYRQPPSRTGNEARPIAACAFARTKTGCAVIRLGNFVKTAKNRIGDAREILRLPKQTIALSGDARARATFERLTKPHPRLPLIPAKKYGVCLLDLTRPYAEYMAGGERKHCRYMVRQTEKNGYTFRRYDPADFIGDMMAINGSALRRQARDMNPDYLDPAKVLEFHRTGGENWGVFNSEGQLCAYSVVPVYGQLSILSRILGHDRALDDGIMFRLVTEIVGALSEQRAKDGRPDWLCYDTYYGASEGLRLFKRRLGFTPMIVNWRWERKS
jgi:hypothetical protein